MSQAELARHLGVSQNAVYAAVKSGRITLKDGRADLAQAVRDWAQNTNPASPRGLAVRENAERMKAAARRETVRAEREEMEFAALQGRYVVAADVERLYFAKARAARNALLAIPARVGRMLAGISDPDECERRLRDEIRNVCRKIGEGST